MSTQSTNITIRAATRNDLENIVALLADDPLGAKREIPELPLDQRYISAFEAIDSDPNHVLAIATDGDTILGCLQITYLPGLSRLGMWRGQIESVRIAASARGQRVGELMVRWAIEQCHQKTCGVVQLTTDKSRTDALRFYERLGFEATHEGMKLIF